MIRVDALYRYPVKGFTPEKRDSLVIQDDGRVQGDRSLVFRFADALEPADATFPKSRGLALMTFPTLARVDLTLDDDALTLRLRVDDIDVTADLSDEGRARLSEAVTAYLRTTSDAKLLEADGILPWVFSVTVAPHASRTARADSSRCTAPPRSKRWMPRCRRPSTIAGSARTSSSAAPRRGPSSSGRDACGSARSSSRCRSRSSAAPRSPRTRHGGARRPAAAGADEEFGQSEPTLGILLLPVADGGTIRVGDEVTPLA